MLIELLLLFYGGQDGDSIGFSFGSYCQVAQGDENHDAGHKGAHLGNCKAATAGTTHDVTTLSNFE